MLSYCLINRSIVQISGEDSKNFLQGLITQDINLVTNKNSVFSLILNNKGRYYLDFFIIKSNDDFLIDIASDDASILEQTLKRYKLRSKVTITINNNLKVYTVFNLKHLLITNNKTTAIGNTIIAPDSRLQSLGLRIITPNQDFIKDQAITDIIKNYYNLPKNTNITLVDESAYKELRYLLIVPENLELIKEKSIPLECGLDELNAISFSKGCYLGQEFTNASKRTLVIRKRLLTFKSTDNLEKIYKEEQPLDIKTINEEKIGTIISSYSNYILALVKIDSIKNNSSFFINNLSIEAIIPERLKAVFKNNL